MIHIWAVVTSWGCPPAAFTTSFKFEGLGTGSHTKNENRNHKGTRQGHYNTPVGRIWLRGCLFVTSGLQVFLKPFLRRHMQGLLDFFQIATWSSLDVFALGAHGELGSPEHFPWQNRMLFQLILYKSQGGCAKSPKLE